ncbi:N-acetyl-1-D-myo-inositol-2-amino-2-deoxy-alpha-D-glucopyranoside deacetylase [Williamsia deligens]|uniref:1D-myo-inositol 2-acetamido-2-deoxy-alpha-D-glucopyranoside deacetylase n=1 Tax=Williamsia deligens TaxID=321325 RepID=A0ABW3G209_9NOCA|nr:N-acetyl-1-D-myo-inositol-2-amino-2-deoxy-alpha-D-glucopyranoside deacetylase [Williamsia deligens]MCP2194969.1 N-acetyl-1-D-myo-inositol-2-amino-2-deoxy-alpha-D-glucopyranoside deacetylase [Williamsia deligens]
MTEAHRDVAARRLLIVHAHPDDESIQTAGVIARYLDAGADVTVVTCTLGEEGEVIGQRWARLVADGGADQLGGYRILELTRALEILSPPGRVLEPHFLGGAGRWRDSGMAGSPAGDHPRAFARAGDEAVQALTALILDRRPQVVVGYDPAGTYGHPDHIGVHRVSTDAVVAAQTQGWSVSKHYWSVTQNSALADGLSAAVTRVPDGWRMPADGELPSYPDDEITTEIDIRAVLERKVDAMAAHATQITVSPSRREYALSNDIVQPIGDAEHFILVRGQAHRGPGGYEVDLFAGIDGLGVDGAGSDAGADRADR